VSFFVLFVEKNRALVTRLVREVLA
jgi:hypothetical protein